ncbi:FCD domain-containing protein [Brooklawnia cerclae]|uniref:GntR family transcriptional repressor for pyruvate dehydrogenase complex n=1 Tax=Brooklawnia cerclae TaxID=349934 RepID=A0ABX0SH44_9ACTN|nr:GntR family transcriptional repressor for pyruvate dehydrogenase complex [Brooklawnia cerclae]
MPHRILDGTPIPGTGGRGLTSDRHVPRRKLSDSVADKLSELITSGEFPVGTRLPAEKDLAQQFGVGRSSMREAIRVLEAAGYVQTTHGVGVFVINNRPTTISLELTLGGGYTMSDLFEVRIALEGKSAELAASRLTDHHREKMVSFLAAASDPGISEAEFVRLDGSFHRQIAEASGNPLLLYMWESIAPQFEEYSLRVIGLPGRLEHAHADHLGMLEAISARDTARAARLAREHVQTVQRELSGVTADPSSALRTYHDRAVASAAATGAGDSDEDVHDENHGEDDH